MEQSEKRVANTRHTSHHLATCHHNRPDNNDNHNRNHNQDDHDHNNGSKHHNHIHDYTNNNVTGCFLSFCCLCLQVLETSSLTSLLAGREPPIKGGGGRVSICTGSFG